MKEINIPKLRFKEFKDEWENEKLKDVTNYVDYRGKTPKKSTSGVQLITASNIRMGRIDYEADKQYISNEDYEEVMHRGKPEVSDVLITTEAPLGNVAPVDKNNIALAQRVIKYSGLDKKIDNNYLLYCFESPKFRKNIFSKASGGTVKGIKGSTLHKINIDFGSYKEQRQIGLFFSKIDNLIELKGNKIDSLERLKRGYLQKLFNDLTEHKPKLRFKGFNDDWKTEKIKNIANFFSGGTPKVGNKEYYKKEIPFIRSSEINSNTTDLFISKKGLDNSSAKLVDKGTILYAMYGATSGKVAISKINGAINQAVLAMKTNNNIDKQFLVLFLEYVKNKIISKYIQGGQGNLSASIIKNIRFKIPTLAEQTRVGNILSLIDKQINLQQKELEHLKSLKKGYLQKMFV